jgi:1,5-anhydro-D-fructose reductase (1,5-anhydro-D-mannitol-forming)
VTVEVIGTEGSVISEGMSPDGQGTATFLPADDEAQDITGATPLSFTAQLDTVTRAVLGESVAYATGADGARNVELLERIDPLDP